MVTAVAPARPFQPGTVVTGGVFDSAGTLYGNARNQRFVFEASGYDVFGDFLSARGGGASTRVPRSG
jgi:hypothetical protein